MIKKAQLVDLDSIFNLYSKVFRSATNGFLDSVYSKEDFKKVIDHTYLYWRLDEVLGLIIVTDSMDKTRLDTLGLDLTHKYIKLIIVDPEHTREGIGKSLFDYVLKDIKEPILSCIALAPKYNKQSEDFRKSLGFKVVDDVYVDKYGIEGYGVRVLKKI